MTADTPADAVAPASVPIAAPVAVPIAAPIAAKRPQKRSHHGHVFIDDYEWLRAKTDTDVIAHLEAENAFTAASTAHLDPLIQKIYGEITARTQETDLSVPVRRDGFWYYVRTVEGKSYGVHCRVAAGERGDDLPPTIDAGTPLDGEEVLLDSNLEAEGHDFFSLGAFSVSVDAKRLLYSVDTEGDERYTIRVKDLTTGEVSDTDIVPGTASGAILDVTGEYAFYCTVDDAWRPNTVWRHLIGTPASDDVSVFVEPDERYWVGVGTTRSRQFLVISLGSKITSEVRMLRASTPTGEFEVVWPRVEGVEYDVEHVRVAGEDRLLITHNDGAVNFETVDVAAVDPRGERRVVVPHRDGVRLDGVDAFATHVAVSYRRDVLTRVGILPLSATGYGELVEVDFDEPLFNVGLGSNPEWDSRALRLGYGSMVTPSTVLSVTVLPGGALPDGARADAVGSRTILKQQPVLGGYNPSEYEQRRLWATADDGIRIPVSLVFKKSLITEGVPAPTLLYGYGSYESSVDPYFSIARLSLLDRGMVFAIAHVRGGGELGRTWYDDGKMLAKKNSFTDFVAVARHLIDTGVTTPQQLVAEGGSAGGLLMGAVVNLAPELFAGILAGVPFVDALTSILDADLPLTVIEWDEWGDPLHNAEVYEYMRSYTPYENVRTDAAYPPILATTSLNDTRVLYVEPAKWVAKLREVGAPALLKTEMSAGHGGVSGRYEAWRERAFELAWILSTSGAEL